MNKNKIAIIGLSGQSIFLNIDQFHNNGETKQANNLYIEPGGKGYNQAVACARLGADVHYLTAVGNDEYGALCEQIMKDEGINTYYVRKETQTALATIITNNAGDNQVTVFKGASEKLNLNDLENFKEIIKECDILLIQNEIPYEVLKEAIIFARSNFKYVIYNPAPAIYNVDELLPYVNLLIPNETEANTIFDGQIEDKIKNNDLNVIITLGSNGSLYINKKEHKKYESIKVKAVDTTGAGDVFCAAIATQVNQNKTIDEMISFATKASGIHVQGKYVLESIPYNYMIK